MTIDLPPILVESLGVGAEVLANYLTSLAEAINSDPNGPRPPPPNPVLCRICERQITPWWFEKHSELCLQEHRAEMDIQIAQENLNEHRHVIVKVLDALEARQGRPRPGDNGQLLPQPEYKGLPIGPSPTSSAPTSAPGSSPVTPPRSRDPSASGLGHGRGRSFAVRRPLARIVELILDLCDTALEINTPTLKETRGESGEELRTSSPQSESRIAQVLQWQSPSTNTLEQEQGLAALSNDTEQVAKAKVDAVIRYRRIVEYAERIRIEYAVMVEECIEAAIAKAERIAAGELTDSTSSYEDDVWDAQGDNDAPPPEQQNTSSCLAERSPATQPQPEPMESAAPDLSSTASQSSTRASSMPVSTRSVSPLECPTPRSHTSISGALGEQPPSKRGSLPSERDAGDNSDSSNVPSSLVPGAARTESPSSEKGLSRAASSRERKRKSLVLPGLSRSPHRQPSPARVPVPPASQPQSPLRLSKPRLPSGDNMSSPNASPLLSTSDTTGHGTSQHYHHHLHHHHHHRRQSSATSDITRPPISPHLSSVSQPPPRPAPTSIKDFEIIKPISKGAFGSVYLAKKKSTGEYYAIKVLKKADMVAKNQVTNVKAERAIMMWQGESDFVAKLYWTFSSKDYLYLVMEYLNGGDCASLIKVLGGLPEDWAKKYIAEVVLGVQHLHDRGIVHRDLKPDNLLIDQKGHLKLTDFGLSRMGLVGRQKRVLKSPNESAPDLLKQNSFPRAMSMTSSRSASFDMQAGQSPSMTPVMTPDALGSSYGQPSYFNFGQPAARRERPRRMSGYRSDSGSSDTLNAMFQTFSLNEGSETPAPLPLAPLAPPGSATEDEAPSEGGDSPYLVPLSQTVSIASSAPQHNTPPQGPMLPPPMALFDPEENNRRFVGTPDYLAPETINGAGQDEMSDWWSLGCILFEFLYGYPPFNAETPDQVFDNILNRRINWPENAEELSSPEARDLMNRLMTLNPQERLGANIEEKFPNGGAEIRSHPWFADINWDTLLEDQAQFVPNTENPEDTEYFDSRGATLQSFHDEIDNEMSSQYSLSGDYPERPHDALSKVRQQVSSMKRGLMPLHIPPHVRESRSRRLSEPALADDFGNFNFKNLPMLEKANKDVIQRLRQEAMQAQQRTMPAATASSTTSTSAGPSLEGSPMLPMPLQRTLSQNKGNNRPGSPSSASQVTSSPNRPSQPSSPLLVQFSTGQNHERRKTSGSSSTHSHQSSGPATSEKHNEPPRLATSGLKPAAGPSAPSPSRPSSRAPAQSPDKSGSGSRSSGTSSRARSRTIGSQDSDASSMVSREPFIPGHHKRRSQLFDVSPSSSDNEDPRTKALLKVQRRRQSSRRLSHISQTEGPQFRRLDVLICEDHPVSRIVMERLFEKLRCRTITAVNGAEAMRYALSEVEFDIIMTEVKLPQISGADVARMVRETNCVNKATPIIAVTGYLKDLPETHHFNSLIEKPPTLTKLTEALCQFCQWKPPPRDTISTPPLTIPPVQSVRQGASRMEDSPSSTSSGFPLLPGSYRGSSREDSIGSSSYFGDLDSKAEDVPVIVSRHGDDWAGSPGGLGISDEVTLAGMSDTKTSTTSAHVPQMPHASSAPPTFASLATGATTPRRRQSIEAIRAKRESRERRRHECAESGDDEDEELGHLHPRPRGSQSSSRGPRSSSKLGTEMMRTDSRGSIEETAAAGESATTEPTAAAQPEMIAVDPPVPVVAEQPPQQEHPADSSSAEPTPTSPQQQYQHQQSPMRTTLLPPLHESPTEGGPSLVTPKADHTAAETETLAVSPSGLGRSSDEESQKAHLAATTTENTDPDATPKPGATPAPAWERDGEGDSAADETTPRASDQDQNDQQHQHQHQHVRDAMMMMLPWRR